jgi:probable H4MPT-linked C1 transfer pathway protein
MKGILGLDIGGANLKAATTDGRAVSVPFALWKHPERLTERLQTLARDFPAQDVAVTMTGELCDCFATKRDGVEHIVAAVEDAFPGRDVGFWSTKGIFLWPAEAHSSHLDIASANWHALAMHLGALSPCGFTLLLDLGSTTCDVIPILDGFPCTQGITDPERLRHGELIYSGVRRTPLCAILGATHAAELFATTRDVYLLLEDVGEDANDCDTADGRPATISHAHARIARMNCDDCEGMSLESARELARRVRESQVQRLAETLRTCITRLARKPDRVFLSGSGEFLLPDVLRAADLGGVPTESLSRRLGARVSEAACAFAVASLFASHRSMPVR